MSKSVDGMVQDWKKEIEDALKDFITAAVLARATIGWEDLKVEYLVAPHKPPSSLPKGKMAVYGFWNDGKWLKIGKAGPNSKARYTSQHYNPGSSRSNLARSLVNDPRILRTLDVNLDFVGDWIKQNTNRFNILLGAEHGDLLLSLLEAFLHLRFRPEYER